MRIVAEFTCRNANVHLLPLFGSEEEGVEMVVGGGRALAKHDYCVLVHLVRSINQARHLYCTCTFEGLFFTESLPYVSFLQVSSSATTSG